MSQMLLVRSTGLLLIASMSLNHRSVSAGIPYSFHLFQGSRHFKYLPLCQSFFTETGRHTKIGQYFRIMLSENNQTSKYTSTYKTNQKELSDLFTSSVEVKGVFKTLFS